MEAAGPLSAEVEKDWEVAELAAAVEALVDSGFIHQKSIILAALLFCGIVGPGEKAVAGLLQYLEAFEGFNDSTSDQESVHSAMADESSDDSSASNDAAYTAHPASQTEDSLPTSDPANDSGPNQGNQSTG